RMEYGPPHRVTLVADPLVHYLTSEQRRQLAGEILTEMRRAAQDLDFERAAELRDTLLELYREFPEEFADLTLPGSAR
ncbi:MAG: UvrB/UvrC motif-containing protein, partial [Candidatus Kapabacteria bacterium]|nr:UvrB/UvrC motif-containing protein [Candidatus Kapabacteria bacterium]MDW7997720.1 UvrB/UvrC motif-containing protein [Bacteroidota bacterium]